MDNEFLANLQREGSLEEKPVESEREEKETPPASPAENKNPDDKTASPAEDKEKDVTPENKEGEKEPVVYHAFHEHPRWIAMQNELDRLKTFEEQVMPLLDRLGKSPKGQEENERIPEWFSTLFGNNEEAWRQYREYDKSQREQLRSEIITEFQQQEVTKSKEQQKMDTWVDSEFQKLKDEGLTFDKNAVIDVALKYMPTDDDGVSISIRKAYDIWKSTHPQTTPKPTQSAEDKKKIADKTMKKGNATEEKKDFKTSADFRGKTFADIARN